LVKLKIKVFTSSHLEELIIFNGDFKKDETINTLRIMDFEPSNFIMFLICHSYKYS